MLYEDLGIFYFDVNLPALAKKADVQHPLGCIRRLLNSGGIKMRDDGLIGRGNPRVRLERSDKPPYYMDVDLSQPESREEMKLRGVAVSERLDLPTKLDASGLTADAAAQYMVYWTTLQQQKRLLQEVEDELTKLRGQQSRTAQEQTRLRKLQDSYDNRVRSAEAVVANCKAAVRKCEEALKSAPLRVAHNLTTLTLTILSLPNGTGRDD